MKCKYSLSSVILAPSREPGGWNASQKGQQEQKKLYRANKQNKRLLTYPGAEAAAPGDCRRLFCSEAYPQGRAADREAEERRRAPSQFVFKNCKAGESRPRCASWLVLCHPTAQAGPQGSPGSGARAERGHCVTRAAPRDPPAQRAAATSLGDWDRPQLLLPGTKKHDQIKIHLLKPRWGWHAVSNVMFSKSRLCSPGWGPARCWGRGSPGGSARAAPSSGHCHFIEHSKHKEHSLGRGAFLPITANRGKLMYQLIRLLLNLV